MPGQVGEEMVPPCEVCSCCPVQGDVVVELFCCDPILQAQLLRMAMELCDGSLLE